MKIHQLFAFLSAGLSIGGCVQQTEVIKLHDNSASIDRPYERLLVVSVSSDASSRRRMEELITGNLAEANLAGTPSYAETGSDTTILQNDIDSAARKTGSDAILITHIASVDTTVDIEPGRVDILSECRGGSPADYFLYDRFELKEPDTVRMAHTVVAITSLYDVGNGARVWTIQSTCFDKASMDEVLREEAKAIVRQLQIDELVG